MSDKRILRVFCPTHEAAFDAIEIPKILCEITGHALSTDFPNAEFWEFCCNCRIFSPSNLNKGEKARQVCYGCGNNIQKRFACANCKVFSFECDSQTKGKNHFISDERGIKPNCPGCRNERQPGTVIWHECEDIDAGFFTAHQTCPFCLNKTSVKKQKQKDKTPAEVTVVCPQCSAKNPASSLFCGECRYQLREDAAVNTGTKENKNKLLGSLCPNCSMPMPPDASFCGECGQAVKKEVAPPPPAPKKTSQSKTESNRKSFDTNVLDPDFVARASQFQQTDNFTKNPLTTAFETGKEGLKAERQYGRADTSNLSEQNAQTSYNTLEFTGMNSTSMRKVEKIRLPEYILAALPYLPFYIGFIASITELFFVPRNETKVRFHAAQALAAHLILFVVIILLNLASSPDLAKACNSIFIITMIVLSIKAFQKKPIHIKFLYVLTNLLNKKINPRK